MTTPSGWKQKFPRIINLTHLFFSNNSHFTFYRKVIRQESRETRHLFHLATCVHAWLGNDCIGLFVFMPQPFDLWTRIHSSWFAFTQKCLKDGDNTNGYWINVNQSFLFSIRNQKVSIEVKYHWSMTRTQHTLPSLIRSFSKCLRGFLIRDDGVSVGQKHFVITIK